ncbi:MAG: UDP-2,4-diacetamido-2,4,6-trideoxy-beta-L-altropyranose hydrolase [Pseudomonadota bacterium]
MRIAFRVDASTASGVGHLKRSLALAHALRGLGADVVFVTREHDIDTASMVEHEQFHAVKLLRSSVNDDSLSTETVPNGCAWLRVSQATDAEETCAVLAGGVDWVVVDHYGIDSRWHDQVSEALGARICVIDDLADRSLSCDLLVDHNLVDDHRIKYRKQADGIHKLLGGPRFALLGPSYVAPEACKVEAQVTSIGIFMGGADASNASSVVLRACREFAGFVGIVEIATTSANPNLASVKELCERSGQTRLLIDQPDLAGFFARHGLQIGAGGGASWERCRVGAPTIALVCADNQSDVVSALAEAGIVLAVPAPTVAAIGEAIAQLVQDHEARLRLHERSLRLVDGLGALRVALAMLGDAVELRPATAEDATICHGWRNDERTRRYSRDPSVVTMEGHLAWWSRSLADPRRRLLIARCGSRSIGCIRLDLSGSRAEVSIYLDPLLTGLGLGAQLLRAAMAWVAGKETSVELLEADIYPDNKSSTSAFAAAGFVRRTERTWTWNAPR